MAPAVPDVRVAVAVQLAEDGADAHRLERLSGVAGVLGIVVAAVDEVPVGLRIGAVGDLLLGLEVVAAAVADRGRDEVLVLPAEPADEAGAVRAAPDEDLARVDRVLLLRPLDDALRDRAVVLDRPAGPLGLARDDDELVLALVATQRLDRAAVVVVLVAVHAVVDEEQREGAHRGEVAGREHVGPHHDALLVLELAVELAGTARFLAAALPLLGKEGAGRDQDERKGTNGHG